MAETPLPVDRVLTNQVSDWEERGLVSSETADALRTDVGAKFGKDKAKRARAITAPIEAHNAETVAGTAARSGAAGDAVLLLLSGLLNGAAFFLFTWVAELQVDVHIILAMWMVSLVPMVYVARVRIMTLLIVGLFFLWLGAFAFGSLEALDVYLRVRMVPTLCLCGGIALFAVGGVHYAIKHLHPIARTYRLAGLGIALLATYGLSFEFFAQSSLGGIGAFRVDATSHLATVIASLAAVAALATVWNMRRVNKLAGVTGGEGPISLGLLAMALAHAFLPLPTVAFVILFNLLLAGMLLVAIRVGLRRQDFTTFSIGVGGLCLLAIGRVYDFFGASAQWAIFGVLTAAAVVAAFVVLQVLRRSRFGSVTA